MTQSSSMRNPILMIPPLKTITLVIKFPTLGGQTMSTPQHFFIFLSNLHPFFSSSKGCGQLLQLTHISSFLAYLVHVMNTKDNGIFFVLVSSL